MVLLLPMKYFTVVFTVVLGKGVQSWFFFTFLFIYLLFFPFSFLSVLDVTLENLVLTLFTRKKKRKSELAGL